MAAQTTDAWAETRKIHKEFSGFYKIAGGLLLVLIGILIGAGLFHNDEGYWGNILSEVLGIGFAVFVLDQRAEQRRIKDLKDRLVMQVRGQSNDSAKGAVNELRHRGWLSEENGILKGGDLWRANLQDASLESANLRRVNLGLANLKGANLEFADLQSASLLSADLQGARIGFASLDGIHLSNANLQSASLRLASLRGAALVNASLRAVDLEFASLQGAYLGDANLQDAQLDGAEFDENTILPDESKWAPDTDMTRFTDPNHPQFWRSDNPNSPAYRGKSEGN